MTRRLLEHFNHELRSPMTVIVGMTDLLLVTADGETRRLLQSVRQAADVLLRMLDESVDFSRLESGTVELAEAEFGVREVFRQAAESLAKGTAPLELSVSIEASVPERLLGDADRLRLMIQGLTRSAAKLRAGRAYELRVMAEPAPEGALLHFLLCQPGITAEPRKLLETACDGERGEYLHLADFARRGFFGAGLGLPVAAGLADLMQGDLWMSAKTDLPVIFRFSARFDLAPNLAPADFLAAVEREFATASRKIRPRKVLLAEDTETNREFFCTALVGRGHHVVTAVDGRAALQAFQANAAQPFDVILLDVEMPVLGGRETAAALRSLPQYQTRPVPIVALTAHETKGEPEFTVGGLFDAAVTKPCDLPYLYALVENLSGGRAAAVLPEPALSLGDARVDYRGTLRRLGGNEQLFYDLRRFFLEDVPSVLDKLRVALGERNSEGIERAAHSLKGLVANFGAREATSLAAELQSLGHQKDAESARPVFERLAAEVELLRHELETAYAPS